MRVAEIDVSVDALDQLALRLEALGETNLAERIRVAIDDNRQYLALTSHERATLVAALVTPPHELVELRASLLKDWAHGGSA